MSRLGFRLVSSRCDSANFGDWILDFRRGVLWGRSRVRFVNDRGQVLVRLSGRDLGETADALRLLEQLSPEAFLDALEALA
jgi:hypothetical protein